MTTRCERDSRIRFSYAARQFVPVLEARPKRIVRTSVLIATVLLAASVRGGVKISGTVTGPDGVVKNAKVSLEMYSNGVPSIVERLTDASGRFSASMDAGDLHLHVEPPANSNLFREDPRNTPVSSDVTVQVRLRRRVRVSGRVEIPHSLPGGQRITFQSVTRNRSYDLVTSSLTFSADLPADIYSVQLRAGCRPEECGVYYFNRENVDARSGSVSSVVIPISDPYLPLLPARPPTASLITISEADADGRAMVTGSSGAAEPLSSVLLINLRTAQVSLVGSEPDGSFTAPMFAPPGSFIAIRHDPTGMYLGGLGTEGLVFPAATVLFVPPRSNQSGIAFANAAFIDSAASHDLLRQDQIDVFGTRDPGQVWFTGTMPTDVWSPGQPLTLTGELRIHSRNLESMTELSQVSIRLGSSSLEQLFDGEGRQRRQAPEFSSFLMTPTGLPRGTSGGHAGLGAEFEHGPLERLTPHTLRATWRLVVTPGQGLPPGIYSPVIHFEVSGIPTGARFFDAFHNATTDARLSIGCAVVKVGSSKPPRLGLALFADEFSNGSRGVVAREDIGQIQLASRVLINSERFVLPMRGRSGVPVRYDLNPYAPLVSSSDQNIPPDAPRIPFRFPSGDLRIRIVRPDGSAADLGSAPFRQSASRTPVSRSGLAFGSSIQVADYYQLTTLDPRFEVTFDQPGPHLIEITGSIDDIWGNVYSGGGTYEVFVADVLDLETGVIPGTPFQVGDSFSPFVMLQPPVAADVEVRLRFLPNSDPAAAIEHLFRGRSNRFGVFNPPQTFLFEHSGEFRVDVMASTIEAPDRAFAGSATWGSIVESPSESLIAHGRRGFDGRNVIQPQWLNLREAGGGHANFPFHTGDVMWMEKSTGDADVPKITVHDLQGDFASRVRAMNRFSCCDPPALEQRIAAGEIPLASGGNPVLDPDGIDPSGYFYAFAERPGVRVRELISDDLGSSYWRFNDAYNFQAGNGINGDLPNDFKFQFGGAVFRAPLEGFFYYGAYASLFVLLPIPDSTGGRIMPPFQGNGGGPDGGPLFRLKNREIDLFFHPTAVRPGTILHRGAIASFAGYSAPTLPSKIEIVVTSPSGHVRTISGQANKIGWFYDPSQDFTVGESGVWKARARIVFDGRTSAGQVTEPFPTGDVLGSRSGEFYFYVVDANADDLSVAPMPQFVRPADGSITFTIQKPAGLINAQLSYTTTMPGFILEEGTKTSMTYVYDAQKLAKDFPNLDLYDADGYAGADSITISFLLSGTDGGVKKHFARQIVIQGEELQMPDQEARPKRRTAR